jgi:hypothetical protein
MGSVLHGNATTTPRIRKEIQEAQESLATLAERYHINEKTVLHWKHADGVEDKKSGPKVRKSALNELEQQAICTVRRHLRLPLDDLFTLFKPRMPALTRSNLLRCLQHYGLSRLPKDEMSMEKKPLKQYNIGYVYVDITELHGETDKWYLFVAIDRLTKYVYVELHQGVTEGNTVDFLRNLQAECVFKITHILTDNGAQFTYKLLPEKDRPATEHPFDVQCKAFGIEHRTTKFHHPWTNGQVEITNKIIKQATEQFHCADPEELKMHLITFLLYYNHQQPLKLLKLKTPWGLIVECHNQNPEFFKSNLLDKIVGFNAPNDALNTVKK